MTREMKDSGVEWIGCVPRHWSLRRLKYILKERNEKNTNIITNNILSLTAAKGVIPYSERESGGNKHKDDLTGYKIIRPNDIVVNSMNVLSGSVGLSKYFGCSSPVYYMLYSDNDFSDVRFYNYIFQSTAFQKSLRGLGNGIMIHESENGKLNTIRMRIPMEKMNKLMLPLPPLSEQQKIADFLDEKVKEIDNAIEKTKETIELYKKYKQAIITEAVTKGLDPNVEMKDSGAEWIGKIPVDWQVKRAKNVVTEFAKGAGITREDVDINGDISCVRYGEIYTKYDIDFVQTFSRTNLSRINTPKYIENGDILFSGTGELVEEIGKNIVYLGNEPCIAGGDIIIAKHKCNASFLNYAFMSSYSQMQKSFGKSKLKVVHISSSDIGNILLAIPPACEQEAIANYLNQKIDLIDFINKSLNELVPMFESYKKSLIYEYVTGKKEVK